MASFLNRMDLAGMLFSWMFLQFVKINFETFFSKSSVYLAVIRRKRVFRHINDKGVGFLIIEV